MGSCSKGKRGKRGNIVEGGGGQRRQRAANLVPNLGLGLQGGPPNVRRHDGVRAALQGVHKARPVLLRLRGEDVDCGASQSS